MTRLSARARLAAIYTALVLAAGTILIGLTYVLVRRSLEGLPRTVSVVTSGNEGPAPALPEDEIGEAARAAIHQQTLDALLTQSAIALAVVTVLAAVLGWVLAGRILRPIRMVTAAARRLSAEHLSERVPVSAPDDEMAALAVTVNAMLDRIEAGVAERDRLLEGQRLFAANAAHELRTPLATMRTAIDVTVEGDPGVGELLTMAEDVSVQVDRSRRTLDGLLLLARSQTGVGSRRPVDLAGRVGSALEEIGGRAAERDLVVEWDLRPAAVSGEQTLIDRLVVNLLDNAVRHNHSGGRVEVATGTDDAGAVLRVSNTGPVIAPEAVERLFEPFQRGADLRVRGEGLGLGLSIVRAVAAAHSGEVVGVAGETGGLDLTVRFPAEGR